MLLISVTAESPSRRTRTTTDSPACPCRKALSIKPSNSAARRSWSA